MWREVQLCGPFFEKGPAAGLGVSVMTQERPLGVPASVSSTNHEVFRKAYWVSQGILRSTVTRHTLLSFLNGNFTTLVRFSNHGAPAWLKLCYPYLKLLFEKIELANVPEVDSRAKKKGFGVDGES